MDEQDFASFASTTRPMADPRDLTEVDLTEYEGIIAPWNDWCPVEEQCRAFAVEILRPD
jgi:hypothetical protein